MPGECGHHTAMERFRSWLHALRRSSRREIGPTAQRSFPLTSEVLPQTSHYLEKKAMCEGHARCEQREANTILQEIEEKSVASRDGVRRL